MKNHSFLFLLFVLYFSYTYAQKAASLTWHDPLKTITKIDGQGWENIAYTRLPNIAEKSVRGPVWSLSRNSAGLSIRFTSNTETIKVEYTVGGDIAMHHMPATGVSGVDLYGKNDAGNWQWYRGKYTFSDPISFSFKTAGSPISGREYQLYLPLYNSVKNLKIGISQGSEITFLPQRNQKPIVVYGTSIAQGACASRPGMAWTNILGRLLEYPMVNLGFSGNGRLEPEVLALVTDVDAELYLLDCLPNLSPNETHTETEIKKRLRRSIQHIREKRPESKILLTQHAGYSDGEVDSGRRSIYETLNRWTSDVFEELQKSNPQNLYMLTKAEINLSNDAFVDGTHPTDLGMEQYAKAYKAKLNAILK